MKIFIVIFSLMFAFLWADFLLGRGGEPPREGVSDFPGAPSLAIPFNHALHGDSLGLDCAACHTGSRSQAHAYFPTRKDCMDCHRLPLTENAGIEKLDSALEKAPEEPWSKASVLPAHVVFHHGVHAAAGVSCTDCHGGVKTSGAVRNYEVNTYGGEKFDMKTCLSCHRGETFKDRGYKRAATYCAACHR
ncbi:MAG: hypothetical protein MJY87_00600 [Fibrobacter sp.]|nr:hypothetical protein [Fibrobacter sp.]